MDQFAQFIPLLLIFAIMYFLLIRPQQKKMKDHQAMVNGLRRGDKVVTAGGMFGKVVKVHEEGEVEEGEGKPADGFLGCGRQDGLPGGVIGDVFLALAVVWGLFVGRHVTLNNGIK